MNAWIWFPVAGLFVVGVWTVAKAAVDWVADRRWARLQRANDRRQLRYDTWSRVSRMRGE